MNILLPIACAAITGISVGVVLNERMNGSPAMTNSVPSEVHTQQSEHAQDVTNKGAQVSELNSIPETNIALESKIDSLLEEIALLKTQQGEINRELNTIQFRLDMHSQEFRPLRAENNSGLAPTISPEFNGNLVLPPR